MGASTGGGQVAGSARGQGGMAVGGCVVQKRVAVYDIPGRCAHVNDCCRARKRVWYKADGRELVRSKVGRGRRKARAPQFKKREGAGHSSA